MILPVQHWPSTRRIWLRSSCCEFEQLLEIRVLFLAPRTPRKSLVIEDSGHHPKMLASPRSARNPLNAGQHGRWWIDICFSTQFFHTWLLFVAIITFRRWSRGQDSVPSGIRSRWRHVCGRTATTRWTEEKADGCLQNVSTQAKSEYLHLGLDTLLPPLPGRSNSCRSWSPDRPK
jgi:hypothetical protein